MSFQCEWRNKRFSCSFALRSKQFLCFITLWFIRALNKTVENNRIYGYQLCTIDKLHLLTSLVSMWNWILCLFVLLFAFFGRRKTWTEITCAARQRDMHFSLVHVNPFSIRCTRTNCNFYALFIIAEWVASLNRHCFFIIWYGCRRASWSSAQRDTQCKRDCI